MYPGTCLERTIVPTRWASEGEEVRDGLHPPDRLLRLSKQLKLELLVYPQQRALDVLMELQEIPAGFLCLPHGLINAEWLSATRPPPGLTRGAPHRALASNRPSADASRPSAGAFSRPSASASGQWRPRLASSRPSASFRDPMGQMVQSGCAPGCLHNKLMQLYSPYNSTITYTFVT